jgi:hypothetical protein
VSLGLFEAERRRRGIFIAWGVSPRLTGHPPNQSRGAATDFNQGYEPLESQYFARSPLFSQNVMCITLEPLFWIDTTIH